MTSSDDGRGVYINIRNMTSVTLSSVVGSRVGGLGHPLHPTNNRTMSKPLPKTKGKIKMIDENWLIEVSWNRSNDRYVNLIMRKNDPDVHRKRRYYVGFNKKENRFIDNPSSRETVFKFESAKKEAMAVIEEVILAKKLIEKMNQEQNKK